jgi:hypothetical protein
MYIASDASSGGPSTVPSNRAVSVSRAFYEHRLSLNMPTEEKVNFTRTCRLNTENFRQNCRLF